MTRVERGPREPYGLPPGQPLSRVARAGIIVLWLASASLTVYLNRDLTPMAVSSLLFFTAFYIIPIWYNTLRSVRYNLLWINSTVMFAAFGLGLERGMAVGLVGELITGLVFLLLGGHRAFRNANREFIFFETLWFSALVPMMLLPIGTLIRYLNAAALALMIEPADVLRYLIVAVVYLGLLNLSLVAWLVINRRFDRTYWSKRWPSIAINGSLATLLAPPIVVAYYNWPQLRLALIAIVAMGAVLVYVIYNTNVRLSQRFNELRVINSIGQALNASLELDELLDRMHHEIGRLFDVSGFYLALYDETEQMISFPIDYASGERRYPEARPFSEKGLTEWVIRERKPLVLQRPIYENARKLGLDPFGPEPQTFMAVPVMYGDRVLAVMSIQDYEYPYRYDTHEIQLLETIAAQAGTALHNATLFQQSQRQAEELSSLNRVSLFMSRSPGLDEVLTTICEVTATALNCQKAGIFLVDDEEKHLSLAGHVGLSERYQQASREIALDGPSRVKAFHESKTIAVGDIAKDERFDDVRELLNTEGIRSVIDVPLRVGERMMGLFTAYYDEPRSFEHGEIALMETLGAQVAIAVENARLFEEMRLRSQEMQTLYEASTAMSASLSSRNVLQAVGMSMLDAADISKVTVFLLDERGPMLQSEMRLISTETHIGEELIAKPIVISGEQLSTLEPVLHAQQVIALGERAEDSKAVTVLYGDLVPETGFVLPLISHGALVGAIAAERDSKPVELKANERQLMVALANQAAITIQNARLFEQVDVKLTQRLAELAALERISQRMSRQLDVQEVIDLVVNSAIAVTEAHYGEVALLDGSRDRLVVVYRHEEKDVEDGWPAEHGVTGRALRTGKTVVANDVSKDPDYVAKYDDVRAELVAPIELDGQALGVINLESRQVGAFSEDHARIVSNLAEYAAIAIHNARLYEASRRQAEEFAVLRSVAVELLGSTELSDSLDVITRETITHTDAINIYIFLYDADKDELTFGASRNISGQPETRYQQVREHGMTARVARSGERIVINSSVVEPPPPDVVDYLGWKELIVGLPLKSGDRVVGVFNIAFPPESDIDENTLHFLELLSTQAAVAIINAQLYASEKRQHEIARLMLDSTSTVTSSLDLGQVLLALSSHLLDISNFHICTISAWDPASQTLARLAEYARSYWTEEGGERYPLAEHEPTRRALETGEFFFMDARRDDTLPEQERMWMEGAGELNVLIAPLRSGEETVGLVEVGWTQDISGAQREAAVEAVRMALDLAAARIKSPLVANEPEALMVLASEISNAAGSTSCILSIWDREDDEVRSYVEYANRIWENGGRPTSKIADYPSSLKVLNEGESVVAHVQDADITDSDRKDLTRWGGRTMVLQPLSDKGRAIGLIELLDVQGDREVDDDDLALWRAVADQASVAIANARLAEQIRAARDRMQTILDSIHDGIILYDTENRLLLANPRAEFLVGFPLNEYAGVHYLRIAKAMRDKYGPSDLSDAEQGKEIIRQATEQPDLVYRRQYELMRPQHRAIEEISIGITDERGEAVGRVFVLRDVTERYELEAFRQELSDMIVHDLRSPLGGIISGLAVALEELESGSDDADPKKVDYNTIQITLDVAAQSANSLLVLVETILDVSKLESGEMPLQPEPVPLGDLAQNVLRLMESVAEQAKIDLKLEVAEGLDPISVDRPTIERVITNLVDNALRYTTEGGDVTVEVSGNDKSQTLAVKDRGQGIKPEDRERIFERFVQLDGRVRRRGSKGSGLGLTFCRLAVEAHGGRIWVDERPGGGSIFQFTLPTS